LLVLEKSYNKLIPPITTVSKVDKTIVPAQVDVSIVLLKIVSMVEEEHKIEPQFTIRLQWNENQRTNYHNLKRKTSLNTLTSEEVSKMWLPLIIYANTDQLESTRLGVDWEWVTTVTVTREQEDFTKSGVDQVDETEIFDGPKNLLTMEQSYTFEFQCHYELASYPFDTQVICSEYNSDSPLRNAP
jgi:hypothetical protein